MFVLMVSLIIRPGRREEFLRVVTENATASVRDEPGCLRFEVLQDEQDADRFYLYEVYADREAFEAHRRTPHFARWRELLPGLQAEEPVRTRAVMVHPTEHAGAKG